MRGRRAFAWALALALLALRVGPAWAGPGDLVAPGEVVAGWRLTHVESHPEYVRFFFTRGEETTGVEVAHWSGEADVWVVGGQRVMPAPEAAPPRDLLLAMHARLRARAGALDLRSVAQRPRGPPPSSPLPWGLALVAAAAWRLGRGPRGAERQRAVGRHLDRWYLAYLALVLLGAAWLRTVALHAPFEADESTQRIFFASLPLDEVVTHRYADQRHPPLFYLILEGALTLGHREAIARLPAVVASLLAIGAAFAWARRVVGAGGALVVAVALATSGPHLRQSVAVSNVTTFLWLTCLASVALLDALRSPERRGAIAGWWLSGVALLACYYMAPLVLLGHVAVLVVFARGPEHRALRSAALALGVAALPTAHALLRLARDDGSIRRLAAEFPGHVWGDASSQELLLGLGQQIAPVLPALVVLAALFAAGTVALGRSDRRADRVTACLIAVTVAATVTVLAAAVVFVRIKPYYGLFVLPSLFVGAVASLRGRGAIVAAAGLGFVLGGQVDELRLVALPQARQEPSYRFDELGAVVRAQRGPSRVIALPNPLHTLLIYYGAPRPFELYRRCQQPSGGYGTRCVHEGFEVTTLVALPQLASGWEEQALARLRAQLVTPAWVVDVDTFPSGAHRQYLERHCVLHGSHAPREGLRLYLCPADAAAR